MNIPLYKLSKKSNLLSSATEKTVVLSHDHISKVSNETNQIINQKYKEDISESQNLLYSIEELTDITNHCKTIIFLIYLNSE